MAIHVDDVEMQAMQERTANQGVNITAHQHSDGRIHICVKGVGIAKNMKEAMGGVSSPMADDEFSDLQGANPTQLPMQDIDLLLPRDVARDMVNAVQTAMSPV